MSHYPDIQFVVLRGRPTVNRHLRQFGASAAHYREFPGSATWTGTFAIRNEMFRWFLAETDLPWLVMLDDDIVLTTESEMFLLSDTDVAGPHVADAAGHEAHPTGLATGAVKFSRKAVQSLGSFWAPPTNGGCGCSTLYNACRKAGLVITKAGVVGHRIPMTVWVNKPAQFDAEVMILGGNYSDAYAGDALIETVGIHYQVDTLGSRLISTKPPAGKVRIKE